ncbi:alpha-1,3-galactosyltransferase 2-like [Amia ocellicauda]|uniref:alpha-1,3-galactosyltransferase 2-like n=1 Tax=Amia ocellicauda TaxID=2972642 RepID=UPI003464CA2E
MMYQHIKTGLYKMRWETLCLLCMVMLLCLAFYPHLPNRAADPSCNEAPPLFKTRSFEWMKPRSILPHGTKLLQGKHITPPKDSRCILPSGTNLRPEEHIDYLLDLCSRKDVQTSTSWGAPIIWDGMFDPELYDAFYTEQNVTVALTVFAVGKYLDAYLKDFLTSAEKHFMPGLRVVYYVFTDSPERVPEIQLGPQRSIVIMKVEKHKRWQDISMMRMLTISNVIESHIRHQAQYVFCLDVDQMFLSRWGSEALGDFVAQLHAAFYNKPEDSFTYDRNPKSMAYMYKGDHYYHAAIFGGTWENVQRLAESCYLGIMTDKRNEVEALWHDESHLNKYFWIVKPTKVLSPEYCWSTIFEGGSKLHFARLLWAKKHYNDLRQ